MAFFIIRSDDFILNFLVFPHLNCTNYINYINTVASLSVMARERGSAIALSRR